MSTLNRPFVRVAGPPIPLRRYPVTTLGLDPNDRWIILQRELAEKHEALGNHERAAQHRALVRKYGEEQACPS